MPETHPQSVKTRLASSDTLPLTCTRTGTCCHGKMVRINPWELACLAEAKKISPRAFRDQFCDYGGIRLRFDGPKGWKDLPSCSQYTPGFGCSVHEGRPLVCRLYPLGRQRQGAELIYIFEGREFPCMEGCPNVVDLPHLTVEDYIADQAASLGELAQDAYLEMMQKIADVAFALLLESGLSASGDRQTLPLWRKIGSESPEQLAERLGPVWLDILMLPEIATDLKAPEAFIQQHFELLESKIQTTFSALDQVEGLIEASALMMGLALHLGRGLGAEPDKLAEHWIGIAKTHGALE